MVQPPQNWGHPKLPNWHRSSSKIGRHSRYRESAGKSLTALFTRCRFEEAALRASISPIAHRCLESLGITGQQMTLTYFKRYKMELRLDGAVLEPQPLAEGIELLLEPHPVGTTLKHKHASVKFPCRQEKIVPI